MAITAKAYDGLKPGIYPATLQGYEESSGEWGPSVKLIWALDGQFKQDGEPVTKWQWVSQKLTPRSNMWNVLKTLGTTPVMNQSYEVDELLGPLVGANVQLIIKMVDGPNGETDKIVDMMAADGVSVPAAAPAKGKPAAAKKADELPFDNSGTICAVATCGGTVDKYTRKGVALCADHDAEDL